MLALAGLAVTLVGCGSQPAGGRAAKRARRRGDHRRLVRLPGERAAGRDLRPGAAGRGFDARLERRVGPRELVEPALASGLVEFVPEYSGTALEFLSLGAAEPTSDAGRHTCGAAPAAGRRRHRGAGTGAGAGCQRRRRHPRAGRPLRPRRRSATSRPWRRAHVRRSARSAPTGRSASMGWSDATAWSSPSFLPLDVGGPLTHQALVGRPRRRGGAVHDRSGIDRPATGRAGRRPPPAAGRERRPPGARRGRRALGRRPRDGSSTASRPV